MQSIDTIVVPQGSEYQAVRRGLLQAKADTLVIAIPLGSKNTIQVLTDYSQQIANSQRVLIVGLCGSLCKSYTVGDTVLIQSCCNSGRDRLNLDEELTAVIQKKLSVDAVNGLTSDRVITQATEKLKLSREHQASVVEMEGYAYISQLQQQGKSVAMLRVVSDDTQGDIPDIGSAISEGGLETVPLAIALLKQPLAATRLIRGSLTGLRVLQRITTKLYTD